MERQLRSGPPSAAKDEKLFDAGEFFDADADFEFTDTSEEPQALDEHSAPVVRVTHLIFAEAVKMRAQEMLLEPHPEEIQVTYFIEGKRVERDRLPIRLLDAMVKRLELMADIDRGASGQVRQGVIKLTIGSQSVELAVQLEPTPHGERIRIVVTTVTSPPETALAQESGEVSNSPPKRKRFWT